MSELILLGDLSFNGLISKEPDKNSERFSLVSPILEGPVLVFANLEFPITESSESIKNKNFVHTTDIEVTKQLLKSLNVRCVSLANNHVSDFETKGLLKTIDILDDLNIYHTGAGLKKEDAEPVILIDNGIKIGFLAYVDVSTNPCMEDPHHLFINYFNIDKVVREINSLKSQVDIIIFSIHWGNDYSNFYTIKQQICAKRIIDAGADIILGHHPHTVQPYEVYKNKFIFYSLGQLCFGDFIWEGELRALKRKTKLGLIVRFDDYSLTNFNIIPTKEKQGGKIIISNKNIERFLKRLRVLNKLKNKYSTIDYLIRFKEAYIDRVFEFIFGYYRNPIKDILKINNLKKLRFMARDFKSNLQ